MSPMAGALRCSILCGMLAGLWGCESMPFAGGPLPPESSVLAVDVLFPVPLGRDPSLVGVFLAKGPIHDGLDAIPELTAATFIKGSRAYLLDPEPGTYSLAAVTAYFAPALSTHAVGVTGTVSNQRDAGQVIVLPTNLIQRTRTTVAPGRVAFMGSLQITEGDPINRDTRFQDRLQQRIAEQIRPGVTSESGLAGRFTRTSMPDLERSTVANEAAARAAFLRVARADFGTSPWASVIPVPATPVEPVRRRRTYIPRGVPTSPAPGPLPEAPASEPGVPQTDTATPAQPLPPAPPRTLRDLDLEPVAEPLPQPPRPRKPSPYPPPPKTSRLAHIEIGMNDDDVRELLGDPHERNTYRTTRAYIPFYTGPDTHQVDWLYVGEGRVVFAIDNRMGLLEVLYVVHDPEQR